MKNSALQKRGREAGVSDDAMDDASDADDPKEALVALIVASTMAARAEPQTALPGGDDAELPPHIRRFRKSREGGTATAEPAALEEEEDEEDDGQDAMPAPVEPAAAAEEPQPAANPRPAAAPAAAALATAAPAVVFPESQVHAPARSSRRRMSLEGQLSPADVAIQRLAEATKFALGEFGPDDPRYREIAARLRAAKQQRLQQLQPQPAAVEPEPEPEPKPEPEPEPQPAPRDPDEYSRQLLAMASSLEASEWDARVADWSESQYERTSIGQALTQLRTQS